MCLARPPFCGPTGINVAGEKNRQTQEPCAVAAFHALLLFLTTALFCIMLKSIQRKQNQGYKRQKGIRKPTIKAGGIK